MNARSTAFLLLASLLLSISALGWGEKSCGDSVDVAIVGAGPSGAYSAYLLRNSGHKVHLYEYSDRIGGRLYTYSLPSAPDVRVELGGMRFTKDAHTRLYAAIKELGLTTIPFVEGFGKTNSTWYFVRGRHMSKCQMLYGDVPYDLTPEEKVNRSRIWSYYFQLLTGIDIGTHLYKTLHDTKTLDGTPLHKLTATEALQRVASPDGLEFARDLMIFHSLFDGNVSCVVTFYHMFKFEAGNQLFTVAQGMSSVPVGLVEEFEAASDRNKVLKNHKLEAMVTRKNGEIIMRFQETISAPGMITVGTWSYKTVCAKRVILALPLYALSLVRWGPIQSKKYQDALNAFNIAHAQKVFMTFDHSWWLDSSSPYYVTKSDESYSQSYDFQNSNRSQNSVLLVSYADSYDADYHQQLQNSGDPLPFTAPGENRVTTAMRDVLLDQLAETYELDVASLPPILSSVAVFWNKYPFGGGWTTWKAGPYPQDIMKRITRPSLDAQVYVVGSDFNSDMATPWVESGLYMVENVFKTYNFL